MQMSGTSNVCRKLQIMLEEQRGLLSAEEEQWETPPATTPGQVGGTGWQK